MNQDKTENDEIPVENEEDLSQNSIRLHVIMIYTSLALIIISMILHYLMPDDQYFMTVGIAAIGFLFGKFTNSFGKGIRS